MRSRWKISPEQLDLLIESDLYSRPGIRTNPLKIYPALTDDRIDDKIQEIIAYQQATGAGPQKGATVSVM